MVKQTSTSLILLGILAVIVGIIATAGPVFGHLLRGLISLAAGVVAVAWPTPTALALVLVIGTWAVVSGLVEMVNGP
jgi:uncharacterized membrane protein HdeD (DUF308 family)